MGLLDRIRGNEAPRVAFIGIDGVPYSFISDHPDTFPHLTALAEEGSAGPIDSIVPPESSACWPSLTSGVNPGKTGVYGFTDREPGTYETYIPVGNDVQSTRIWDRVTDAGRNATVMNVPITFPPQRSIQRMVSGMLSPSLENAAVPEAFAEQLSSIEYRLDTDHGLGLNDNKQAFIQDAHETVRTRYEAFKQYVDRDDWDLFFGVFMATDRMNHFLFRDYERDGEHRQEFLEFYQTLDEYLGQLREALAEDTTLIIASDHGFTSLDYEVNLNNWLREEGWLSYDTDEPESLADITDDTRAYAFVPGRFYLNLEGRDPRGSVPQDEYQSTRAELKELLLDLDGPDGEPVCSSVVEKEDAFHGEHDDLAPDLVAIPNPGFDLKGGFKAHLEVFDFNDRNGMHTFDNASLFIDRPNVNIDHVDLLDLTPTMLDLMEITYDRDALDGESLV